MNILQHIINIWRWVFPKKRKSEPKIAVFGYGREFKSICFEPRDLFVHIRKVSDIMGRDFIGCIRLYGWDSNKEYIDALNEFRHRNRKLFKK